jgi:hypothetical protein
MAPYRPHLSFFITSGDIYIGVPVKLLCVLRLGTEEPEVVGGLWEEFASGARRDCWIVR